MFPGTRVQQEIFTELRSFDAQLYSSGKKRESKNTMAMVNEKHAEETPCVGPWQKNGPKLGHGPLLDFQTMIERPFLRLSRECRRGSRSEFRWKGKRLVSRHRRRSAGEMTAARGIELTVAEEADGMGNGQGARFRVWGPLAVVRSGAARRTAQNPCSLQRCRLWESGRTSLTGPSQACCDRVMVDRRHSAYSTCVIQRRI